jgi:predicted RNase H-like HicB family nuclease
MFRTSLAAFAAAGTLEETRELMRDGLRFHIEPMVEHGEAVAVPTPVVEVLEVDV